MQLGPGAKRGVYSLAREFLKADEKTETTSAPLNNFRRAARAFTTATHAVRVRNMGMDLFQSSYIDREILVAELRAMKLRMDFIDVDELKEGAGNAHLGAFTDVPAQLSELYPQVAPAARKMFLEEASQVEDALSDIRNRLLGVETEQKQALNEAWLWTREFLSEVRLDAMTAEEKCAWSGEEAAREAREAGLPPQEQVTNAVAAAMQNAKLLFLPIERIAAIAGSAAVVAAEQAGLSRQKRYSLAAEATSRAVLDSGGSSPRRNSAKTGFGEGGEDAGEDDELTAVAVHAAVGVMHKFGMRRWGWKAGAAAQEMVQAARERAARELAEKEAAEAAELAAAADTAEVADALARAAGIDWILTDGASVDDGGSVDDADPVADLVEKVRADFPLVSKRDPLESDMDEQPMSRTRTPNAQRGSPRPAHQEGRLAPLMNSSKPTTPAGPSVQGSPPPSRRTSRPELHLKSLDGDDLSKGRPDTSSQTTGRRSQGSSKPGDSLAADFGRQSLRAPKPGNATPVSFQNSSAESAMPGWSSVAPSTPEPRPLSKPSRRQALVKVLALKSKTTSWRSQLTLPIIDCDAEQKRFNWILQLKERNPKQYTREVAYSHHRTIEDVIASREEHGYRNKLVDRDLQSMWSLYARRMHPHKLMPCTCVDCLRKLEGH